MKKLFKFIQCFSIAILLMSYSCTNDAAKVNFFNLSVVFAQDMKLSDNQPMSNGLQTLLNYKTFDSCTNTLFVPKVTFIREDLNVAKSELLPLALTWLNSWKSDDFQTAHNLKEDYDNELKTKVNPKIATLKSERVAEPKTLIEKYPEAIYVMFDKNNVAELESVFKKVILPKVCNNTSKSFVLILNSQQQVPPPVDTTQMVVPPSPIPPSVICPIAADKIAIVVNTMKQVADRNVSRAERKKIADLLFKTHFTEMSFVLMDNDGTRTREYAKDFMDYLTLQLNINNVVYGGKSNCFPNDAAKIQEIEIKIVN